MGVTARRVRTVASLAAVARAAMRPGGASLAERAAAVPRLVRATRSGRYHGTTPAKLATVAAAAAYVASPIDLVPEALLPVVGLADDAMVLTWAVNAFMEETDRFLDWERTHGLVVSDAELRPGARTGGRTGADRPTEDGPGSTDAAGAAGTDSPAAAMGRLRQAAARHVLESARRRLER